MFIQVKSWKWGKEGKRKARAAGSAGMVSSQGLKFGGDEPKQAFDALSFPRCGRQRFAAGKHPRVRPARRRGDARSSAEPSGHRGEARKCWESTAGATDNPRVGFGPVHPGGGRVPAAGPGGAAGASAPLICLESCAKEALYLQQTPLSTLQGLVGQM